MKINVSKFGPIENAVIEFAPMLVFTGNSNLGKSYINYLMYYVVYSLSDNEELSHFISQKKKDSDEFNISILSLEKWLESRVEPFMRTFLNAPELECSVKFELLPSVADRIYRVKLIKSELINDGDNQLNVSGESSIKQLIVEINGKQKIISFRPSFSDEVQLFFITKFLVESVQIDVFGRQIDTAFILPPARGAFVGENYTMKDKISSSVGMYRMFLNDYDKATQPGFAFRIRQRKVSDKYNKEIERIINGKLISQEGKQFFVLHNGQQLPLSAAASSIKELSPFLFSLQVESFSKKSFCIEEPEAHLHPQMQISVTDLISKCFSDGMMFQMTTHSDYVIQRLNQFIKLNYIRTHDKSLFQSICSKSNLSEQYCLNPNDVKMYYFSIDDKGKVAVTPLTITEKGVPMVTFFEVVSAITRVEDILNNAIDLINERRNDGNE